MKIASIQRVVPRKATEERGVRRRLARQIDHRPWLTIDVVAAFGGDRTMTKREKKLVERARKRRGTAFYADVVFVLSNQYFPPKQARSIWNHIRVHKRELERALDRNPGIMVAALDFLANIHPGLVDHPTVVSASTMASVVHVALTDGLTGLFDHTTFRVKLNEELQRYRRYGDAFSVVMFDIDDFKHVNDTRGHLYGDRVLAETASIIEEAVRETDCAARYGGEEFAILAPRTPTDSAEALAERIRKRVKRRFARRCATTLSAGVATCPRNGETSRRLLGSADRALYSAKRAGKNSVVVAAVT